MIEFILQTVILPVTLSTLFLLLPRFAWSVESNQRIEVWSAAPALAFTAILSLYMVEGPEIWQLTQKWNYLWVTALILALGGAMTTLSSRKKNVGFTYVPKHARTFILIATSAIAIFVLQFPNQADFFTRIFMAVIASIATLLMSRPARSGPITTPAAFCISLATIAVLLLVSGSMKVALVALSLSLTSGICALLASHSRGFSGGASFAMTAMTLSIALGLYGMSYHNNANVASFSWFSIPLIPILLCVTNRFRSKTVAVIAITMILILCGTLAFLALRASQSERLESGNSTPYTLRNDSRTFPKNLASSILWK